MFLAVILVGGIDGFLVGFFAHVFQYCLLHISYVICQKAAIIFKKQMRVTQKDRNCHFLQFILK